MNLHGSFINGYNNIDSNNIVFATEEEEIAYLLSLFGVKGKVNRIARTAGSIIRESQTRYENTYRIAQKLDNEILIQRMHSSEIFADKVAYAQTLKERRENDKP